MKNYISDISYAKSVNHNGSDLNLIDKLSLIFRKFKNISRRKNKNIFFRYAHINGKFFVCGKKSVLAVNGDREFGLYK